MSLFKEPFQIISAAPRFFPSLIIYFSFYVPTHVDIFFLPQMADYLETDFPLVENNIWFFPLESLFTYLRK